LESENVVNVNLTDYLKALSIFEETQKFADQMHKKNKASDDLIAAKM